jgi:hypothetical protein
MHLFSGDDVYYTYLRGDTFMRGYGVYEVFEVSPAHTPLWGHETHTPLHWR